MSQRPGGQGVMLTYYAHATSRDNEEDRKSGWNDPPLSDKGVTQATALGESIAGRQFDRVFSSDLQRAVETARIALPGSEIFQDSRLRELNYGRLNGAPSSTFPRDEFWCIENRFEGGECCLDVQARVEAFLDEACAAGTSIALFAHRYPQLALEVIVNGISWQDAIANDWRRTGAWQPGWAYDISDFGKADA